ncbi:MAG: His/Gly/Thr/Pro-type tRNA ligase C-terminal domain-containing protein, partial [Candidatus Omnitrophota bacterium]|nr:His/Gly/Thr/Pro-type tRNA ligase C-terminal domain-containing protein [Candidatus Omnitrophota bacterium]
PFNIYFTAKNGKKELTIMGSYGIGLDRLMAAIVEAYHDEKGIIWPKEAAPFKVHLIEISGIAKNVKKEAEKVCKMLFDKGIEVLYDDRDDKSAGEKFADADLIGIPKRIVISEKTLNKNSIEIKDRKTGKIDLVKISNLKNAKSLI